MDFFSLKVPLRKEISNFVDKNLMVFRFIKFLVRNYLFIEVRCSWDEKKAEKEIRKGIK